MQCDAIVADVDECRTDILRQSRLADTRYGGPVLALIFFSAASGDAVRDKR